MAMKIENVLSLKGEPIILNDREEKLVNHLTRHTNSLGYDIQITTLTAISKKISEQKFFEIAPADYLPVVAGEGQWSEQITTYRSFELSDEFETGMVNVGGANARLATADAGVDAVNLSVKNWAKTIGWSIIELELASRSGNWDLVSSKEKSRKKNWDLGIQRVAFLGARGSVDVLGLLAQPSVNVNTAVITKAISSMTTTELKTFTAAIMEAYRSNCNRTAWPTHFIIPESDYNGLASQASPDFPIKSTLQLIEEMFQVITRNKSFKILPLAYGDSAYHADVASIAGKQVYMLLNYDEESLKMCVPVQYTNTLANSIDNFSFQNVGYGQFTGVVVLRPLESLYFTY